MTDQFEQIRDHFLAALEKEGLEAQLRCAAERCGDSPELLSRVEEMIRAHHQTEGFLASQPEATQTILAITEKAGTQIGPYKLLQQIGEGGMGVVYMAEQKRAGPPAGRFENHQAGDGHASGDRPVRGRAAGAGDDGPSEHRQRVGCRSDRQRPPLLCDGTGQRSADHAVLRRTSIYDPQERLELFRARLPRGPACPPKGDHSPRSEAVEHAGRPLRRAAGTQGDRLRRGQGRQPDADREDDVHRSSARSSARWST